MSSTRQGEHLGHPGLAPPVEPSWGDLLDRAISGELLRPKFQPIIDLQRGTVAGYEALARFADGPPVAPNLWFEEAARRGLAADLDAAMLSAVLDARATLPDNTFLTVNIEPESLHSPEFFRLLRSRAPLQRVVIEVTEHRELGDPERTAAALDELRAMGCLIAIDDAGAGHSGLQQILLLRPEILKLDRALVEGIDRDEAKAAMVEMLGVFANRIDAWVLAEGIETAPEALRCRELGVPLAQGWFFGRAEDPWTTMLADARGLLEAAESSPMSPGLVALLTIVPTIEFDDLALAGAELDASDVAELVVIRDGRPIGFVNRDGSLVGAVETGLMANVHTTPSELALRLATRENSALALPTLVSDNAGRYLGVVTTQRLLAELG